MIVAARCSRCRSSGGVNASSQWGVERKYSSELAGSTSSILTGIRGRPRWTARSTSRSICCDWLA